MGGSRLRSIGRVRSAGLPAANLSATHASAFLNSLLPPPRALPSRQPGRMAACQKRTDPSQGPHTRPTPRPQAAAHAWRPQQLSKQGGAQQMERVLFFAVDRARSPPARTVQYTRSFMLRRSSSRPCAMSVTTGGVADAHKEHPAPASRSAQRDRSSHPLPIHPLSRHASAAFSRSKAQRALAAALGRQRGAQVKRPPRLAR